MTPCHAGLVRTAVLLQHFEVQEGCSQEPRQTCRVPQRVIRVICASVGSAGALGLEMAAEQAGPVARFGGT